MAQKISLSPLLNELYVVGDNPLIKGTPINIPLDNIDEIFNFALTNSIDLTIVGPENPLELGIVNLFQKNDLPIFGPTKEAVKLETSKSFAKNLMAKYNIPTAEYHIFNNYEDSIHYGENCNFPIVIKFSGLAFGKGVVICNDKETYDDTCTKFLKEKIYGDGDIVVEEFLDGEEFSYISLAHGTEFSPFATARDYKRIYDNDLGPNTGGMGMVSPHPSLTSTDIKQANQITFDILSALSKENITYLGFLYAGLISTKDGVKVIEFNARMGDPEGELLFNKMDNDLLLEILNCLNNKPFSIINDDLYHIGVVLSATGYPESYKKAIDLSSLSFENSFLMNGTMENDKLLSSGGRVIFKYNSATTLSEARRKIYNNLNSLNLNDLYYRKDIGGNFESSNNNGIQK